MIRKFRKLQIKISRNSRNGKRNVSFVVSKFSFFQSTQYYVSSKMASHTKKRAFCHLDFETMGFPPPLKVFSTSSSVKQYQFFLNTNSSWNIERLLCKSEFVYSDKIRSHKKLFATYITNHTWRVKKMHVILIFTVGYHWLDKLVSMV